MSALEIAAKIPAEYRKEILFTNMIQLAQANRADPSMYYLFTIWSNYVEPGLDMGCGVCLERVLHNLRELQPILISMEKNTNMLNAI